MKRLFALYALLGAFCFSTTANAYVFGVPASPNFVGQSTFNGLRPCLEDKTGCSVFILEADLDHSYTDNTLSVVDIDRSASLIHGFASIGWIDDATNQVTPDRAGKYKVTVNASVTSNYDGLPSSTEFTAFATFYIRKNGTSQSLYKPIILNRLSGDRAPFSFTTYVDMNGTTDYIDMIVAPSSPDAVNSLQGQMFVEYIEK